MSVKSAQDGSDISAESCRVGIRVPPFYPEKPALWFAQLEGQFQLANVSTDATKYYYAMGQLEPQYAAEVEDIITTPPLTNKYEKLKSELIKRLSVSREKKVKQLLIHEELGDRKPSQFLRHLQNLAGPGVPEDFLRTIWSSRLPASTQSIIASQPKATLEELAELADRIHDVVSPSLLVASTSTSAPVSCGMNSANSTNNIEALSQQIAALTARLDRMSRPSHRPPRSRSGSRTSRTRSHSLYRKYPKCWYHAKFGDQAKKCMKPCDYTSPSGNATRNR